MVCLTTGDTPSRSDTRGAQRRDPTRTRLSRGRYSGFSARRDRPDQGVSPKRRRERSMKKQAVWLAVAVASVIADNIIVATAQSPDAIRLGVLDDMSGPYAENSGPGDVLAVKMAASD